MKSVGQVGSEEQEQDRRVGLAENAAKRSRQKAGIAQCCSCSTMRLCGTSWRFTCRRHRCAGPAREQGLQLGRGGAWHASPATPVGMLLLPLGCCCSQPAHMHCSHV